MRVLIVCLVAGLGWALPANEKELAEQWLTNTLMGAPENNTTTSTINLNPDRIETEVACTTENHDPGVCVLYYLCDQDTRTVIADGTTLIDVRERKCPHYLEVCCLKNKVVSDSPPSWNPSSSDAGSGTTSSTMGDRFTTVTEVPKPLPQAKATCGWSSALTSIFKPAENNKTRILADFGEFPWMVAVLLKGSGSSVWNQADYRGGGTLVHPSLVLTVAHMVKRLNVTLKVRAGEWDTQTTNEAFPFQERDVKEKLIHPKYFPESQLYDFALLFLARPFDLSQAPHIGVACLAPTMPAPGTVCYSMGWGRHSKENSTYAMVLKKVSQTLMDTESCRRELMESYGPLFQVHKSLTCAVDAGGQDTCEGDGGSPLVCPVERTAAGEQRYVVVGLVAYGVECGLLGSPAMYAKVPKARKWVDTVVAQRGLPALETVK